MQLALFDHAPEMPPGFAYQPGFLPAAEETAILREVQSLDLHPFRWHEYTGKRRIATFGWSYSFDTGEIRAADPLPPFLQPLKARAAAWAGVGDEAIQQALVTEYAPGAGIGWHRDAPPFGIVLGISLLSDCRFRLRLESEKEVREMNVEPRSIYKLSGPARTVWQHGIPSAGELRYSITFRTLRPESEARKARPGS